MGIGKLRRGEELFITVVEDASGKKLENWRVSKEDYPKVVKILNKKFGLNMIIKNRKVDRDLDWIR